MNGTAGTEPRFGPADPRRTNTPRAHDSQPSASRQRWRPSTLLAVEQVAHGASAGLVQATVRLARRKLRSSTDRVRVRIAALRTAIGKAGLVWSEFKFFPANHTGFNRKRHLLHDNAGHFVRQRWVVGQLEYKLNHHHRPALPSMP